MVNPDIFRNRSFRVPPQVAFCVIWVNRSGGIALIHAKHQLCALPGARLCRKLSARSREASSMDIVSLDPGFGAELRGLTLADVASDDAA
jgi:hypothetical protein